MAIKKKESAAFKKMCELLNEFYKMVIWTFVPSLPWLFLNGLSEYSCTEHYGTSRPYAKKGYKYGVKWKGKKAKPEREKLKDRRGSRSSSEAPKRL
ncbi:MAG: hypothetical protein ACLTE2_00135 [Eubacteriales bacterium]